MRLVHPLLAALAVALAACAPEGLPMADDQAAATAALKPFDDLMASFMAEHKVPGAAVAVTRGGRLVYARGFGYADVERKQTVTPTSLFRLASVSKPVTAVAVLQLVERGRLKLDDRVFDILRFGPLLGEGASVDPRLEQVTVRQLLHHTGGWDRGESFDPMFRSVAIAEALGVPPPARPPDIIRYMMGQPLQFDPGARYTYSNFGYSLLGRVIEELTGKPYEAAVQEAVLAPLGVEDMRIGATLPGGRAENEVCYYDPKNSTGPAVMGEAIGKAVPQQYGAWYLEGFDAHGGWIASAVDAARFAAEFDDPATCRLLTAETIRTMFARPAGAAGHNADGTPRDAYYGCGWNVRPVGERANHWHMGMVVGTATLLVRRHDGLNWAVLFNSHAGAEGKFLAGEIDPLVHRAADAVAQWPDIDLFTRYGLRPVGQGKGN